MGNQGKQPRPRVLSVFSVSVKFFNICELKTNDTRKKTLLIKFEECSCGRKRAIEFLFSIHLCVNVFVFLWTNVKTNNQLNAF